MLDNEWAAWSKHVLMELERLYKCQEEFKTQNHAEHNTIREEVGLINSELAVLRFKSGLWGAAAGAIPAIMFLIYFLWSKILT